MNPISGSHSRYVAAVFYDLGPDASRPGLWLPPWRAKGFRQCRGSQRFRHKHPLLFCHPLRNAIGSQIEQRSGGPGGWRGLAVSRGPARRPAWVCGDAGLARARACRHGAATKSPRRSGRDGLTDRCTWHERGRWWDKRAGWSGRSQEGQDGGLPDDPDGRLPPGPSGELGEPGCGLSAGRAIQGQFRTALSLDARVRGTDSPP